jgi:hypothetical protein
MLTPMISPNDGAIEICRRYTRDAPEGVVFKEPFLPVIPEQWNGILVLGCAENLGADNTACEWRTQLKEMKAEARFTRLSLANGPEGRPWENRGVRLSLVAIFPQINLHQVAYGNAVPWSLTKQGKSGRQKDATPTPGSATTRCAKQFWADLFRVWAKLHELSLVVSLGHIARQVAEDAMRQVGIGIPVLPLYFPNAQTYNIHVPDKFRQMDEVERNRAVPAIRAAAVALGIKPTEKEEQYVCCALSAARKVHAVSQLTFSERSS